MKKATIIEGDSESVETLKAKEIFHKHSKQWHSSGSETKLDSIITVNEILNVLYGQVVNGFIDSEAITFWEGVKIEMEKL